VLPLLSRARDPACSWGSFVRSSTATAVQEAEVEELAVVVAVEMVEAVAEAEEPVVEVAVKEPVVEVAVKEPVVEVEPGHLSW